MSLTGGIKWFRVWTPVTKKINLSKDVTIDKSAMLKQKVSQKDDKTSNTS